MKRSLKFMVFPLTLFFLICCERNNQISTNGLVGTWQHIKIDSCRQYVYPNSEIFRIETSDKRGITEFYKGGSGFMSSSKNILCGNSEFIWFKQDDILTIRTDNTEYITQIEILNDDTILLILENCLSPKGLKIWYELHLSRTEK